MADKPEKPDRLTVQLGLHYESVGFPTFSQGGNFARVSDTKEQPYQRRLSIDASKGWINFDTGHLESVGYVLIENKIGRARQANPTDEELEAEARQHLEISFDLENVGSNIVVRAGACALFEIAGGNALTIRSVSGTIPVIITCFPR